MTVQMDELDFRKMGEKDLDQIMMIEAMSFPFPWCRESFQNECKKDHSVSVIAEWNECIVGYVIGWHVLNEIHIANIAVHPEWRRKGIAEKMIRKLLKEHPSCDLVLLEVRRSNYVARSLYHKLGFHETGVRKNYYTSEGEDAILMEKRLSWSY